MAWSELALETPLVLLLLPLAALPFLGRSGDAVLWPSLQAVPLDPLSQGLDWLLRVAASVLIAVLVLILAGPYRPPFEVERIGTGAHMVLLVDRSRSMDQSFVGSAQRRRLSFAPRTADSKGLVARRVMAEFVSRRQNDMFSLQVFSTFPITVVPLTARNSIIQAAIAAGNIGRGLAETDIGLGLERALEEFADKPYTGSRIILLVSDGAGELNQTTRVRVAHLAQQYRVSLYWIFIRSYGARPLEAGAAVAAAERTPEQELHAYFRNLPVPYHAYTAEDPESLRQAIEDVSRLQNRPLRYRERVPREPLGSAFLPLAALLAGVLLVAALLERRRFRGASVTSRRVFQKP